MLVAQEPQLEIHWARLTLQASLSLSHPLITHCVGRREKEKLGLSLPAFWISLLAGRFYPHGHFSHAKSLAGLAGKNACEWTRKFKSMMQMKQSIIALDLSHFLNLKEGNRSALYRHPIKPETLCRNFWHDKEKNPLDIMYGVLNNLNEREIAAYYGSLVNMDKLCAQRVL